MCWSRFPQFAAPDLLWDGEGNDPPGPSGHAFVIRLLCGREVVVVVVVRVGGKGEEENRQGGHG